MNNECVYNGLAQIPLKYLKEELLPKLKNPDYPICLNGYFHNLHRDPWPMIAALPGEEIENLSVKNTISSVVNNIWKNLGSKDFDASPQFYKQHIQLLNRTDITKIVQEIIYDKERKNVN